MLKLFFTAVLFCILIVQKGSSQSAKQSPLPAYTYHPPSQDKISWQRLNIWMSTFYYGGMRYGRVPMDSSLIVTSKKLGLPRLSFIVGEFYPAESIKQAAWFDQRDPGKGTRLLAAAKGEDRLELLIFLGAYYAFERGSHKLYKDSIEKYLNKAIIESKTIDDGRSARIARCLLGKLYTHGRDTTKGNAVFAQLFDDCKRAGDKKTEAQALVYRGIYTAPISPASIEDKIGYYKKAISIYHELNDTESEAGVTTILALLYVSLNRMDDAYQHFLKALQLENSIGYPYTHYNLDHLATATLLQDKYGEPLKYSLESIKVAELTRDSVGLPDLYLRLGTLYTYLDERHEESLKWMRKSLDLLVRAKDPKAHFTLLNVVPLLGEKKEYGKEALELVEDISKKVPPLNSEDSLLYFLALSQSYLDLGEFPLAWQNAMSGDSILKASSTIMPVMASNYQTVINILFTDIHIAKKEWVAAKKLLQAYFADSTRITEVSSELLAYKSMITVDSALNDAPSEVKHYRQYLALLDSSFKVSRSRQAEELKVIYETQEKENEINSLNQQAKLQEANLQQATLVKKLTIGGIIAAIIIAGLLYRQSRQRKKTNTIIVQKNEQLEHLVTEKDWLVKEIHHRVKNNFHIVASLLEIQSSYLKNKEALSAVKESQHRIHSMSIIHQKLYQSENLSTIYMPEYIYELVEYLRESYGIRENIGFDLHIDKIELNHASAITLGLILNETITNSIKYAFANEKDGKISISLNRISDSQISLSIADNGSGLPSDFDSRIGASMGMELLQGLTDDLGGSFSIENKDGTHIKIIFGNKTESVADNSFRG